MIGLTDDTIAREWDEHEGTLPVMGKSDSDDPEWLAVPYKPMAEPKGPTFADQFWQCSNHPHAKVIHHVSKAQCDLCGAKKTVQAVQEAA